MDRGLPGSNLRITRQCSSKLNDYEDDNNNDNNNDDNNEDNNNNINNNHTHRAILIYNAS